MSVAATTVLDVRPVTGALGAEVHDVDLTNLSDSEWQAVRAAEHLVLFFPDQHLSPDAHMEFARRFGELEIHHVAPKLDDDHPEIIVLDSSTGARADAWHTDVTCSPTPPMASILNMVLCPERGGDTVFTNQYLVYESISEPLRDLLDGLTALHDEAPKGHPEINATHPVVRIHPETRRRSLYVNRGFTRRVAELRRAESDALLEYLFRRSDQPEVQCRYRWQAGTIGIWDNRCTQHYGVYDYNERRIIQRVTVLGDKPEGQPSRWESSPDMLAEMKRRASIVQIDPRANSIKTSM